LLRWDAIWYWSIAFHGYGFVGSRAFFPAYPLLGRIVGLILPASVATLVVSWVAFVAAMAGLAKLAQVIGPPWNGRCAVISALCFPTSVFLLNGYSESLVLAFLIWGFVAVARKRWGWASIAFAGAAATRPEGILAAGALAIGLFVDRQSWRWLARRMGWPIVAAAGLGGYMIFLWRRFGDPLAFLTDHKYWARVTTLPFQAEAVSFWRLLRGRYRVIGHEPPWNGRAMVLVDDLAVLAAIVVTVALVHWARSDARLWPLAVYTASAVLIGFSSAGYQAQNPTPAARVVLVMPAVHLVAGRVFSGRRAAVVLPALASIALVVSAWYNLGFWVS
jgi:hypothetical protein